MTNATTINFAATTSPRDVSTVDFDALAKAYNMDDRFRFDINEIFANVCNFLYWSAVRNAQRLGVTSDTISFIEQNRNAYLERTEYVENRIHSSLSKVIRRACSLNCIVPRNGGSRVLTRYFAKEENGYYSIMDAQTLALDIAHAYETHVGKSIMETRWDFK